LWLQSVDAGEARLLVAPDAVFYTELSFSPDGNFVYYIVSRLPERTLYRISVGGGAPEKISKCFEFVCSFSDGAAHCLR
jgi:hypothetical protein